MVDQHFDEIDAEFALTEAGNAVIRNGQVAIVEIETAEKVPHPVRLVANGISGHASRPRVDNAVVHLAGAVAKLAAWQTPMRLNDTTRTYFEKLATVSTPEEAARYNGSDPPAIARRRSSDIWPRTSPPLFDAADLGGADDHQGRLPHERDSIGSRGDHRHPRFARREHAAVLRGDEEDHQRSGGEIRRDQFRRTADDAAIAPGQRNVRGLGALRETRVSARHRDADDADRRHRHGLPQAKGVQSYGIGPAATEKDYANFGAHSDVERLPESSLYPFVEFTWNAVTDVVVARGSAK